ncbi:MAG: hypothetical protein ACRD1E_10815, partial [Terriglobales bacterium]
MITALVLIAAAVVVLAAQRRHSRAGTLPGAALLRDIGIAGALLYVAIEGSRFWIDYAWWRELGQASTFWQFLRIRWLPQTVLAVVAAAALMLGFRMARRHCATALARTSLFGLVGYPLAALLGVLLSINLIDPWVIALYLGAH